MKKFSILIIEDEEHSANKLVQYLLSIDSNIQILEVLKSIKSAVTWLQNHSEPDVIFLDINLSDGLSFRIFEKVSLNSFIIFLTAHEQYAIKAFELNSIDYILKPFTRESIKSSLAKLDKRLYQNSKALAHILDQAIGQKKEFKSRFIVKKGKKISAISVSEIAYFYKNELVFLVKNDGVKYAIDYKLEQLEELLNPKMFFRLNRQFIAHFNQIESIERLTNNRLSIQLNPAFKGEIVVSQKKSAAFKAWLNL